MRLQSATWIVILLQILNNITASKNTDKIKKYERQQIGIDYASKDYDEYDIHVLRQKQNSKHRSKNPFYARVAQLEHFKKHELLQLRHRKPKSGKYTLAVPIELIQQSEEIDSYRPIKLLNLKHTQQRTSLAGLHAPDHTYGVIQPRKKSNGRVKVTQYRDHDYSSDSKQNIPLKEQSLVSAYSPNPLTPTKNATNSLNRNHSDEYYSDTNFIESIRPISSYSSFSDPPYYPDPSSSPDSFYPTDSTYITGSSYNSEPSEILYPIDQSDTPFSPNFSNVNTSSYPSSFPSSSSDKIYPPGVDSNDPLFSGTYTNGPSHQTHPVDSPEQSDKNSSSRFTPGISIPTSDSNNQYPDNPTPETSFVASSSNWTNIPNNTKDLSYPHEPPSSVNLSGHNYSPSQHHHAGPSYFPGPPNPSVPTYHLDSPSPSAPVSLYSPGVTTTYVASSSEEYYSYEIFDEHENASTKINSELNIKNSSANTKYSALLNSTSILTADTPYSDEYSSEEHSEEYTNPTHPKTKSHFSNLEPVYNPEPYPSYTSSPVEPFTNYAPKLYGSSTYQPIDFQQKSPFLLIAPLDAIAIPKLEEYYSDEHYSEIHSREHSEEHSNSFDSEQNTPYPSHNRPSDSLPNSTYASEEYYSDESINKPDSESYESNELSSFPGSKHQPSRLQPYCPPCGPKHLEAANRPYSPMYPTDYYYPYYEYPRRPLYPPKGPHNQYPSDFSLPPNELHTSYSPGPINPTNQHHYPFSYPPGGPDCPYPRGYYYSPGIMYPPDRPQRPHPSNHKYYPNQPPYKKDPSYPSDPHLPYSLSRPHYAHPYPSGAYSFNPSKYPYLPGVPNRSKSLPGHQYPLSGANTPYSQVPFFSPYRPHHHHLPELTKKQLYYPTGIYPPGENHHSYHPGLPNPPRDNKHSYHPSSRYTLGGKHNSHHASLYYLSRGKQYLYHPSLPNPFSEQHPFYHASQPYFTGGKHQSYHPGVPYHPDEKKYPYYSDPPYPSGAKQHPYHHYSPHPVDLYPQGHKLIYSQSPSNSLYPFRENHNYPPNYSYPIVPSNNSKQKYIPKKYWEEHYWERRQCEVGTSWTINCYDCTCLKGAKAGCTRKRECEPPPPDAPKICKPYSKFSNGCKTCKCNGDGMPVCIRSLNCNEKTASTETTELNGAHIKTNTKCPKQVVPKEWVCEPGTTWSAKCHQCTCDDFGQAHCERIRDCIPKPFGLPSSCKPGSDWNCVGCVCDDDGEQMDEQTYLNIFG